MPPPPKFTKIVRCAPFQNSPFKQLHVNVFILKQDIVFTIKTMVVKIILISLILLYYLVQHQLRCLGIGYHQYHLPQDIYMYIMNVIIIVLGRLKLFPFLNSTFHRSLYSKSHSSYKQYLLVYYCGFVILNDNFHHLHVGLNYYAT